MSLRLRLLLAVGAIALVALVVADVATYSALRSFLYKQIDQSLAQQRLHLAVNPATGTANCWKPGVEAFNAGNSGSGPDAPEGGGGAPSNFPNAYGIGYIAVTTTHGTVVDGLTCAAYVGDRAYSPQLPNPISGFTTQPVGTQVAYVTASSTKQGGPDFRVQATELQNGDVFIQAFSLGTTTSTLHTLLLIELAVTGGALVLALAGGWWLVRLGLRPLEDVEATADSIAAGNLDQRVPGAEQSTEVGRLARALNVMLERIQAAFSARLASEARLKESEQHLRQFVADASHELRTPIAAVSAYAELFERGAAEHSDDLPRVVSGIRTETARMERLVNDLLTLARLDEGVPMERAPVELVSLASEAVRTATAVGPEWPVRFWAAHPVEVVGDKDRLRQVVDNLLANVRAHTPVGTTTTVRVEQDGDQAQVEVRDTGPGMPADEARRVFERFYRVDQARSRISGGSGLGLSIVAAIVAAHGGTVSAASSPGHGMTVTVRIPMSMLSQGEEPESDHAATGEPPESAA